jgi:hypothetical protein
MKVVGIVTGAASLAVIVFKVHLFTKLRRNGQLLPGYRGPTGFFSVFAYGTKGDHILGRDTVGEIADILEDQQEERNDQGDEILSALYELPHRSSMPYVPPSVLVGVTASASGLEMSNSVRNFFAVNKLEHVGEQINALGVKSTDDLMFLEESDLTEAGLPRVDMRRFKAGVQNMRDAATAAASDVEQKNDQDDTVTPLAAAAAAAGEKAEEKNKQDDADTDTTNVAEE